MNVGSFRECVTSSRDSAIKTTRFHSGSVEGKLIKNHAITQMLSERIIAIQKENVGEDIFFSE